MGCVPILGSMKKHRGWDSHGIPDYPSVPTLGHSRGFLDLSDQFSCQNPRFFVSRVMAKELSPWIQIKLTYLTQIIDQILPEFRRYGWIGCCKTFVMIFFKKQWNHCHWNPPRNPEPWLFCSSRFIGQTRSAQMTLDPRSACTLRVPRAGWPLLFLVDGETNGWAHQVLTNRTTCKLVF